MIVTNKGNGVTTELKDLGEGAKQITITIGKDTPIKDRMFISDLMSMYMLFVAKNHDYGDSTSKTYEDFGLVSYLVRMEDKLNRLKTLVKTCAEVDNESISDTLLDLANYAILAKGEIDSEDYELSDEDEEDDECDDEDETSEEDVETVYSALGFDSIYDLMEDIDKYIEDKISKAKEKKSGNDDKE